MKLFKILEESNINFTFIETVFIVFLDKFSENSAYLANLITITE
jgi:hypothetical protein